MSIYDDADEIRAELEVWQRKEADLRAALATLPRDSELADRIAGEVDHASNVAGLLADALWEIEGNIALGERVADAAYARAVTL